MVPFLSDQRLSLIIEPPRRELQPNQGKAEVASVQQIKRSLSDAISCRSYILAVNGHCLFPAFQAKANVVVVVRTLAVNTAGPTG